MDQKLVLLLVILLIICLYLTSCATSSGNLFKQTYDANKKNVDTKNENTQINKEEEVNEKKKKEVEEEEEEDEEEEEEELVGLDIQTTPDGAKIYIDNVYYGTTPLLITDLESGDYKIELKKSGYYEHEDWFHYNEDQYVFYEIYLKEITGFLNIKVKPEHANITLGGRQITSKVTEIPVGYYNLNIELFGYLEHSEKVTIYEEETTSLEITLEVAPFEIRDLKVNRNIFNPGNPGLLGRIDLSFYVTSFGSADTIIYNEHYEEVFKLSLSDFNTWNQIFSWNGRNIDNEVLPDGNYEIKIQAKGKKDDAIVDLSTSVTIDSSINIAYRSVWNGTSGLIYAATPDTLPGSSFQISMLMLIHIEETENETVMFAPTSFSMRAGLNRIMEIVLSASPVFSDLDYTPFSAGASLKIHLLKTNGSLCFNSGLYTKATYFSGTGADNFTNYTGLSLGIPLQFSYRFLSLLINPEAVISYNRIPIPANYDQEPEVGFFSWGYGRIGLLLDFGTIIAGLSTAVRTTPLSEGINIQYPLNSACEIHFMIPETTLYITLTAASEFASTSNYFIMGGFGLHFIY